MVTIIDNGSIDAKRYIYKICKCGRIKETEKRPYCRICSNNYYKLNKKVANNRDKISDAEVIQFVNTIIKRGEYMSLEEIFVNLIYYFDKIADTELKSEIEILNSKDQLFIMWLELKKWSSKKESNI